MDEDVFIDVFYWLLILSLCSVFGCVKDCWLFNVIFFIGFDFVMVVICLVKYLYFLVFFVI